MTTAETRIPLFLKKPEFEDYLRFIFKSPSGPIKINRKMDIGRFMFTLVKYSDLPVADKYDANQKIDIILPKHNKSTDHHKHCYWSSEDIAKINDFILVDFNIFFGGYMLAGKEIGIQQKDLVEAFIAYTGIGEIGKKFDTLKKKDYRHRNKLFEILNKSIEKIGYQTGTKNISDLSL